MDRQIKKQIERSAASTPCRQMSDQNLLLAQSRRLESRQLNTDVVAAPY